VETYIAKFFLVMVFLQAIVETFLSRKNKIHIHKNRSEVPAPFREKISLPDHQKAADYSMTKINFGQIFQVVGIIVLLIWTVGGGLEALDLLAHSFNQGPLTTGVIFFGLFAAISMLLSLPQSIYSTFVIEERFGFNKMTAKMFIVDNLKGLALGAALGLPLLYGILWIMETLGNYWWVYAWVFLTVFQLFIVWLYPTVIAPLFNKFEPLAEGEARDKIEQLLERCHFTSNGLFVMDASARSSHGNAYFTGFGKSKRIVLFDTLLKSLNPDEVQAVLAHELGHFKHKHVLKGMIRSFLFSLIGLAILGMLKNWEPFYLGHGVSTMTNHMALMLFVMVSGVYTFWMTPLFAAMSRKHEFEADAFAAKFSRPQDLIEALVKLYKDNASTLTPDPLYSSYYHSHPPALIRVEHLQKLSDSSVSS
jgi:STE24 endopeptidase